MMNRFLNLLFITVARSVVKFTDAREDRTESNKHRKEQVIKKKQKFEQVQYGHFGDEIYRQILF